MSTDNPSRPEDEAPARTARDKSVDTGGTPATGEPSLEVPALAPVLDADGEILDMQEAPPTQAAQTTPAAQPAQTAQPAQSDSDATPVTPTANGPGSGTATPHTPHTLQHGAPRTATPHTPQHGAPRTATPHTPQHGTYASGAVAAENTGAPPQEPPASAGPANPVQGMPDSLPGQAEPAGSAEPSESAEPAAPTAPAAGAFPAGGAAADPLNLEKPEPIVLTPDTGQHDEAAEEPVEDTAVRRRSLFTPAQPAPLTAAQAPLEAADKPSTADPALNAAAASPAATARGAGESTGRSASSGAGDGESSDAVPAQSTAHADRTRRRSRRTAAVGDDDVPLDGSIVVGHPKSRTATHWAGALVSIIALPVTWFFLHDGAAMATVRASGSYAFDLSARGLTELAIGALALIIAMWVARRTSVGSIIVGVISILLGLPFLIAPGVMTDTFTPFLNNLSTQSALGQSLSTYLWTDAVTGKFLALGLFMVMVGVVSHSARRAGRHEQEILSRADGPGRADGED